MSIIPVSYTHLDVYKRQAYNLSKYLGEIFSNFFSEIIEHHIHLYYNVIIKNNRTGNKNKKMYISFCNTTLAFKKYVHKHFRFTYVLSYMIYSNRTTQQMNYLDSS